MRNLLEEIFREIDKKTTGEIPEHPKELQNNQIEKFLKGHLERFQKKKTPKETPPGILWDFFLSSSNTAVTFFRRKMKDMIDFSRNVLMIFCINFPGCFSSN